MTTNETCPHCGAEKKSQTVTSIAYECHSSGYSDGDFYRTFTCYERQLAAKAAEIERLKTASETMAGMVLKAVIDESEACAKVCEQKVDAEYATGKVDHNEMGWAQSCAIAIRARGEDK